MPEADYRLLTDATGQRMAAALESMSVDRAAKTDLTSIIATGTTNTTGATITAGTYFYLNGTLVKALTNIASGATFTSGTNYTNNTEGALNTIPGRLAILLITTGNYTDSVIYSLLKNSSMIQPGCIELFCIDGFTGGRRTGLCYLYEGTKLYGWILVCHYDYSPRFISVNNGTVSLRQFATS